MKLITLSQGLYAKISDCDYERVSALRWSAQRKRQKQEAYYARRSHEGKALWMHRFIIGAQPGQVVDHINGDGLDNQRENLRFVTYSENRVRARTARKSHGFQGISKSSKNRWKVGVTVDGHNYRKSGFFSAEDAAKHHDEIIRTRGADLCRLNFPTSEEMVHQLGERPAILRGAEYRTKFKYDWASEFIRSASLDETFAEFLDRVGCHRDAAAVAACLFGHQFKPTPTHIMPIVSRRRWRNKLKPKLLLTSLDNQTLRYAVEEIVT